MFPNTITLLNIPHSHNGSDADGKTGEESEGKPMDTFPHSRNGRRITELWLEWKPTRLLKQAVALCAVCRCSRERGWWSRGRGSRAKNAVVDVESGWSVSRKSPWSRGRKEASC